MSTYQNTSKLTKGIETVDSISQRTVYGKFRVNGNVYYLLIFLYVMVMVGGFIQNISIIVACIR